MAETEPVTEETEKKGKGKIILLGVVLLAAIGASIGGTLMIMGSDELQSVAQEEVKVRTRKQAIYHNLRPAFIVNFVAGNKSRYLQAEVTVMSRDQEVIEAVIDHSPLVRSRVINFFADQDYLELQTPDGREGLRSGLQKVIEDVLAEASEPTGIETILLTNLVMQ